MTRTVPFSGVLGRRILIEATRLFVVYAVAYLALFSLAVSGRLVRDGAPLLDVLMLLPHQMAFPATIALPLALVTAVLACIGRMRDDGEIIALMASGIPAWRAPAALLPLVLATAVAVGALAHLAMPAAYRHLRESMAAVMRQAIGTRVARRIPIFEDDEQGISITAGAAQANQLADVFVWHRPAAGAHLLCFAPRARWVADPHRSQDALSLRLELLDARMLHHQVGPEAPLSAAAHDLESGRYRSLVIDLHHEAPDTSLKPDTMETPAIRMNIGRLERALAIVDRQGEDHVAMVRDCLALGADPVVPADIRNWRTVRRALQRQPLRAAVPDPHAATLERLATEGPVSTEARLQIIVALNAALPGLHHHLQPKSELLPRPMRILLKRAEAGEDLPLAARCALNRIALANQLGSALRDEMVTDLAAYLGRRAEWGDDVYIAAQRKLRGLQMAWHLRWMLSAGVLAYWLFASGLALSMPTHNRMVAIFLGLLTVVISILPGFTVVKGLRGHLGLNPGWILWTPTGLLLLAGGLLLWRRR